MKAKIFELEAQLQGQEMAQELEARTTELASVRNELELMKLELTDTQQALDEEREKVKTKKLPHIDAELLGPPVSKNGSPMRKITGQIA